MVSIREYQYKKIHDMVYIGVELEAKEENYYKNSLIKIEFVKDYKVVKKEALKIPIIVGSGIFYIGKELKIDVEFDNINLALELGKIEYETTFNENVKLEFNSMDLETRKISYRITNEGEDILSSATLNLVFFNKGILIGGTDLTLENLLNQRVYYFEYKIPSEIEFTEVQPFLLLPSTNHLLFKGFYEKYKYYNQKIKELDVEIDEIPYEKFVDETHTFDEKIEEANLEVKKIRNKVERSKAPVLKNNVNKIFKNLFKEAREAFDESENGFLKLIKSLLRILKGISIFIGIVCFLGGLGENNQEGKVYGIVGGLIFICLPIALYLLCYIPYFIYFNLFKTKYDSKKNYITKEEKAEKIKAQNKKIESLKLERENYVKSIDAKKELIALKNEEIDTKNEEIEIQNEKIFEEKSAYQQKQQDMINAHEEYSVMLNYDKMDFEIVEKVINSGKYTFEEVESERKEIREAIEKMEKENEERLRQLAVEKRQEARLEALQKELKLSEQRWKDEVREQNRRAEAIYRDAQRQAWYREQNSYAIAKQVGKIAESQKQMEIYEESFYNKYH